MENKIILIFLFLFLPLISSTSIETALPSGGDIQTTFFAFQDDENYPFDIDLVPPVILIVYPGSSPVTTSTMNLYLYIGEKGSCNYSLNNAANITMSTVDNRNFLNVINTPQPNGVYLFRFYCQDQIRNKASSSISVTTLISNTSTTTGAGEGGGGGGGETLPNITYITGDEVVDFSVSPDFIEVNLNIGEPIVYFVNITNTGETIRTFEVFPSDLLGFFLVLGETKFTLNPGESKRLSVGLYAKPDGPTGFFLEKLEIISGNMLKPVRLSLNVKGKNSLFDVQVNASEKAYTGENVEGVFKLFNLGNSEKINILIEYSILDLDGKVIATKQEAMTLNKEIEFKRNLRIPFNTAPGNYYFFTKVYYEGLTAHSSDLFQVERRKGIIFYTALIIVCIFAIIRVIYLLIKINKRKHRRPKSLKFLDKIRRALRLFFGFEGV